MTVSVDEVMRAVDLFCEARVAFDFELFEDARVVLCLGGDPLQPHRPEIEPDLGGISIDFVDRRSQGVNR